MEAEKEKRKKGKVLERKNRKKWPNEKELNENGRKMK